MMSARSWGLDVGSTGIKAVEITRTWKGRRVTNYGFFPFSRKESEGLRREKLRCLGEILPKVGKNGEGLVLPLASHRTVVHRIPLPFRDRKKNEKVVKFEVEPLLPFPIDRVVVDFYSSEKNRNEKGALVFAVQKEDLGEQISLLREAGLDPESVVPEGLALFWLAKGLGITSGTGALLDLGHEKTTMILWCDDSLFLVRSIPVAGGAIARAVRQASPLSPRESGDELNQRGGEPGMEPVMAPVLGRLAEEIWRTLFSYEYAPGGRPVENIFLTGGVALLPGVEQILGKHLQKPVTLLEGGENTSSFFQEVPREHRPALAVALGAALRGASSDRINFRKEEFSSSQKAQKAKTQVRILVIYAVILVALGIGSLLSNLYLQEKRYRDLKGEIRKEFLQAMPGVKKVVNELQQMKAGVREERARLDSLGGLSGAGSPLEIIRDLSLMIEPAWKVRVTELVVNPESAEINGEADSFEAVNQLKTRLEHSSSYKEVQLKTARASSLEQVIEFKLQLRRGT
jgi:general secretion pathway protein L